MLHTLCFSLQNAVYFTLLPFLVPVLFTFYIQGVLNVKLRCQKVNFGARRGWVRVYFSFFLIVTCSAYCFQVQRVSVASEHRHATSSRTHLAGGSARHRYPLPDNTQHSQETNIHVPSGTRTRNPIKRVTADLRLRPRGHRDWRVFIQGKLLTPSNIKQSSHDD